MEVQTISKNTYNVLSSGSRGNCEIAFGSIAIDMGVPFSMIKPYLYNLQLVCVSHIHSDHMNINTLKKIALERPTVRFGIGEHMVEYFKEFRNIDVYEIGKWYDYGSFKIAIGKLYHDTPNNFYRIEKDDFKIFRATDTATLTDITAKGYDLYAIEHNYNEDTVFENIAAIEAKGGFAYQKGAVNTHLSEQKARDFIFKNRAEHSQVVRLHETSLV